MRLFSSAFPLIFLLHAITVRAKPTANVPLDTADDRQRVIPRMPMPAMKFFQRGEVDMRSRAPQAPSLPLPVPPTSSAPKRADDSSIATTQEEGNDAPINGTIAVHPGNVKDVKART